MDEMLICAVSKLLDAKSYHNQLTLNWLSNRESLIMVFHLPGTKELDNELEEFILEKTEGVTVFIEELMKSLAQCSKVTSGTMFTC